MKQVFQEYLTPFSMTGTPTASGYPTFPLYTSGQNILNLQANKFEMGTDNVHRTRCAFWQRGLYSGQDIGVDGLGISEGVASAVIMKASHGVSTCTGSVVRASNPLTPVAVVGARSIPIAKGGATTTTEAQPLHGGAFQCDSGTVLAQRLARRL